jgi:hypothetical protein
MKSDIPEPDPHFGTDEQMLAWCEREGITPQKDAAGQWDWHATWTEWKSRKSTDA